LTLIAPIAAENRRRKGVRSQAARANIAAATVAPTAGISHAAGIAIVWDDLFATDEAAYAEFERTAAEEEMRTFLDSGKIIPFRR